MDLVNILVTSENRVTLHIITNQAQTFKINYKQKVGLEKT
jgi:hypothetical protein